MTNFWWTFLIGTAAFLILAMGLVAMIFVHLRVKFRLQKEKVALLEESERRYSDLFNNVTDIVYIHSLETGEILQVNRTVEQLLGCSAHELIGSRISRFVPSRDQPLVKEYLQKLRDGTCNEVTGILCIRRRELGRVLLLEYRSTLVTPETSNRSGRIAVRGIARDVTEQKRYERSLKRAGAKLEKLLHQSIQMQEDLEHVSRELQNVQEGERHRISRELHDEVGQLLATVKVNLEILKKHAVGENAQLRKRIADTQALVDQVFDQLHHFLKQLRPIALDELGLVTAVRQLAKQFINRTGIPISVSGDDVVEGLNSEQKVVVYRIVQESLTNAIKHARPTAITIGLGRNNGQIFVEIVDNGLGFDSERTETPDSLDQRTRDGLGLIGMRERVKMIHGELSIWSRPGQGTRIEVRIPVEQQQEVATKL